MRIAIISALVLTASCVSSSEHERLQRRYQLLELEKGNALHSKSTTDRELADAKNQIDSLERRLANAKTGQEDTLRALGDVRENLAATQLKLEQTEARLAHILEVLSAGKLDETARQSLVQELTQATTNPASAPNSLPAATTTTSH